MFNRKPKIKVWFLTLILFFMAVVQSKAGNDFDPVREEAYVIAKLRDYTDLKFKIRWEMNKILDDIEKERSAWAVCLSAYNERKPRSESGHPELYYLWLVEKFDGIYDLLDEKSSQGAMVYGFIEDLLDLVFKINNKVCCYHEVEGWSVAELCANLTGTPGQYTLEFCL